MGSYKVNNRISNLLRNIGSRKLLVPFFTVGFPTLYQSLELMKTAIGCGADMIELGMPFSDPLADGPQIQYASHTALENKIDLNKILESVHLLRTYSKVPIILMGYYNPLFVYGVSKFLRKSKTVGVDGFIIPDIPPDEAREFRLEAIKNDLSCIFLVAPTTDETRIKLIDKSCTDFVYAVTVTGVTGSEKGFNRNTERYMKSLRRTLSKPFVAGFGVSSADSATGLVRYSDGVVIGSALVKAVRSAGNRTDSRKKVERLLTSIRVAI